MKFETVMLKSFFVAGLLVCAMAMSGMLTTRAPAPESVATIAAHR